MSNKKWSGIKKRKRPDLIAKLLERDGNLCKLCNKTLNLDVTNSNDPLYTSFDHILPLCQGGTTLLVNLRLTHQRCNNRRREASINYGPENDVSSFQQAFIKAGILI